MIDRSINYLNQIQIIPVEAGTEFQDPATGEIHVVDDEHVVTNGNRIYCTQDHYDRVAKVTTESKNG
jgi:hypothetical protein